MWIKIRGKNSKIKKKMGTLFSREKKKVISLLDNEIESNKDINKLVENDKKIECEERIECNKRVKKTKKIKIRSRAFDIFERTSIPLDTIYEDECDEEEEEKEELPKKEFYSIQNVDVLPKGSATIVVKNHRRSR